MAWVTATWPSTLTSSWRRRSSSGRNSRGPATTMPALFTTPCRPRAPVRSSMTPAARAMPSSSVMSNSRGVMPPAAGPPPPVAARRASRPSCSSTRRRLFAPHAGEHLEAPAGEQTGHRATDPGRRTGHQNGWRRVPLRSDMHGAILRCLAATPAASVTGPGAMAAPWTESARPARPKQPAGRIPRGSPAEGREGESCASETPTPGRSRLQYVHPNSFASFEARKHVHQRLDAFSVLVGLVERPTQRLLTDARSC